MARDLAQARRKYAAAAEEAFRRAPANLVPVIGRPFSLSGWNARTQAALRSHWGGQSVWDWAEIFRRHRDPDQLAIAIWSGEGRLCGIALCLATRRAIEVRFAEGSPATDCPLKGFRLLIVLEAATIYGQKLGRAELCVQPKREALRIALREVYGFAEDPGRMPNRYFRRSIAVA